MTSETNSLRAKTKRILVPAVSAMALLFALTFLYGRRGVDAAAAAGAALDNASVSSLVDLDKAVEEVASHVTPAVVNVAVTSRNTEREAAQGGQEQDLPPGFSQFFGQQGRPQQPQIQHGIGSGVIVSPDGYIVTNNHVVDGAVQIRVTLNDRRILPAKLIGTDKLTDLAVIKVDAKNLPSIGWGDSSVLKPGQTVLAFGSPFGYFQFSVTRGIISAVDRPNPYRDDPRKPGGYIQTDAAINPGNSGGPLVNSHGEVIGINTFIISETGSFAGAGFAIPAQLAKATVDQLIQTGSVHHGYLGVGIEDVTPDNSKFFNLADANGAIVTQVTPDSPGSRAGLRAGDVITKLDGQKIPNSSALQLAISERTPGTTLSMSILREGKSESVSVKLGEFKNGNEVADGSAPEEKQQGKLGLAVNDLTPDIRQQLSVPTRIQGVAVQNVRPASPAEEAGLSRGDVIVEINRHPVDSAENFVSQVHSAPANQDLLLLVWSNGNASYRVIHPDQGSQNGM
jgi:serine protease Do